MTIAFVQKATATGVSATSITTPAFASPTTVGNDLIACASAAGGTLHTWTLSDSKSNTWSVDAHADNNHAGNSAVCAVGRAASITTAGTSHTVSANYGTASNSYQLVAAEFSGLGGVVDQTATGTAGNSTTSLTATTAATGNANDLLVGCFSGDTNSTSTGVGAPTVNASSTGVTVLETVAATSVIAIQASYLILAATDTQAVKWSYSSDASGQYAGAVAIYEGAASSGATGSAAITEGSDTASGTGSVGVSGSAGITEDADTVAASGAAGASGSAGITEGSDAVSGTGSVGVSGSAGILEGADAVAATGSVGVSGSAAISEGADAVAASGSATTGATGTADIAEGADAVAAQGTVGVSGSATVAEAADTVSGQGSVPAAPSTGPIPAGRSKPRRRYYVEVDGVSFDVENAEQARSVLERAKTLAREAAEASALTIEKAQRLTTDTIAPVKLSAPKIRASPELRLPLKSVRRSINKIYREKSVILELRMWLELEQRLMEDDEEAMLLLH